MQSTPEAQRWESPAERAWRDCEVEAVRAMTAVNRAVVELVEVIARLLREDGWHGVSSPEQWVGWKANVSHHRAGALVAIARRRDELPSCWAAFADGRITEDAMARIARRVPPERDAEVAQLAQAMTIPQLTRVLSSIPLPPDPEGTPDPTAELCRSAGHRTTADGWVEGSFLLPPDEGALVVAAWVAGRDAELRDRNEGRTTDEPQAPVSWADGLVRMASEAADELDATFQRTGHRGQRHQVVIHHDVDPDGTLGPGQLHLGPFVTDAVARYLACDADVTVVTKAHGRLLGITPSERTPNRRLRRYLERRDGGCAHPLCSQRRWLHAHHLVHWEDGGRTVAANLLCLCPLHHRALHHGELRIEGDPEAGDLRFLDRLGRPIEPPRFGADPLPPPPPIDVTYVPPSGERFIARDFSWN